MRRRALFGAAFVAVLTYAVLPSSAAPKQHHAIRVDGPASSEEAKSSAGCATGAVGADSVGGHLYKYCGEHWPLNKLPVRVHINSFNARPNAGAFQEAVRLAVQAWDAAAPIQGTGPRPSGCASARIICVSSISYGPGGTGEVDIRWGATGVQGRPGAAEVFTGPGGLITDVDVRLNPELTWFGSTEADKVATGAAAGLSAGIGCLPAPALCPDRFDVFGIVTHELGHALGLEDLNPDDGNPNCDNENPMCGGWPNDLNDGPDYSQVMYAFSYQGSSTKRVPREGDIAGLYRVMLDSMSS